MRDKKFALSTFPSKRCKNHGGKEEGGQACKVINEGERNPIHGWPKEKGGVFIPLLQK
jgi:hypothetical protein